MLVIKLQRRGKKHQPSYRVVVQEKRSKLDGEAIDDLGWFDPKSHASEINKERVVYWMGVGAQTTPTVHNLLITKGVLEGKKIPVHKHVVKKVEPAAPAAAPSEAPAVPPEHTPEEPKAENAETVPDAAPAESPQNSTPASS